MRTGFNTTFLAAVFMLTAIACTRKADVRLPPHQPALVLHSYTDVGTKFRAALGKTIPTLDLVLDTATFVRNGWMAVYEGTTFLDSLIYDLLEERYVARTAIAEAGKTYTIIAGAAGYPQVEATAKAALSVPTTALQHLRNARSDIFGSLLDDIKFSFNDPPAEKNYYLATLTMAFPGTAYTCVYTYDPAIEKYTEGLLPFDQNSCINSDEIIFTDQSFNGNSKQITISANSYSLLPWVDPATGDSSKPFLKRFSISADHYKYFKHTNMLHLNSGGPTLSDPIIIKGNVKNGYGLFTIYSSVTDTLP